MTKLERNGMTNLECSQSHPINVNCYIIIYHTSIKSFGYHAVWYGLSMRKVNGMRLMVASTFVFVYILVIESWKTHGDF